MNCLRRKKRTGLKGVELLGDMRGMTIVELMIVLTIIASIMGLVGFFVFGALDKANVQESKIEIGQLSNFVQTYYLTTSPKRFPNTLAELEEGASPITEKVPRDPWGSDYIYKIVSKRKFEIYSTGPDGVEGNDDDVHADE
jgi:general secretion pathway protein G